MARDDVVVPRPTVHKKEPAVSSGSAAIEQRHGQLSKALEIRFVFIRHIVEQVVEIGDTVFKNTDALTVQTRLSIQIKDRTAADDRIQGHQLPFVGTGELGPPLSAMGFPQ